MNDGHVAGSWCRQIGGLAALLVLGACGAEGGGPGSVEGSAAIYNGPVPGSAPARASGRAHAVPVDGVWIVSPDQVRLSLTHVDFSSEALGGGQQSSAELDCEIPYDRSEAGLAQLIDCPFTVDEGSWRGVRLTVSSTYQMLIDDDDNGIYTDPASPTLLTLGDPPVGGAQLVTVTTSFQSFPSIALDEPLVLVAGDSATLSVVVNGLQFTRITVAGGTAHFGLADNPDPGFANLAASVGAPARVGYYVRASIGTGLSYDLERIATEPGGPASISTYYSGATTPSFLLLGLNGAPQGCPVGMSGLHAGAPTEGGNGGYLGLDDAGVLGWATPTDGTWSSYAALWSMPERTTLGDATTVQCVATSSDPVPAGDSFSSGAPDTSAADYSAALVLVAQ